MCSRYVWAERRWIVSANEMDLESRCGGTLWEPCMGWTTFYKVLTAPGGFREDATLLTLRRKPSVNTTRAAFMAHVLSRTNTSTALESAPECCDGVSAAFNSRGAWAWTVQFVVHVLRGRRDDGEVMSLSCCRCAVECFVKCLEQTAIP